MLLAKCPTCGRREPRSLAQNAFYWEFLGQLALKTYIGGHQSSETTWALFFRKLFLGYIETKLPGGEVIREIRSTTDCDKDEFAAYLTKCQAWALEELGFFMPDKGAT